MRRLREFWETHREAEGRLRRWLKIASGARWQNLGDVRETFPHADPVRVASGATLTVFNVEGNRYRIVARLLYEFGRVYIKAVLSHEEYSEGRWKENL